MIDALCSAIRETGVSDSGAAAKMSLHPSTMSRWKRDFPDFALLLRTARESFRDAQLSIIFDMAQAGRSTSWRAAAWILERVFPEDYAPRAAERAKFQELFDARCASEAEGSEIELPHGGEPLQNVQNAPALPPPPETAPAARMPSAALRMDRAALAVPEPALDLAGGAKEIRLPERPLQNVQNSPLAGAVCPPMLSVKTGDGQG